MNDLRQPAAGGATAREDGPDRLLELAQRVAHGWADQLGVSKDAVEWVAVKDGRRTLAAGAEVAAVVHRLDSGAGIAFILGGPGLMDVLFVVTGKGATCSVNLSNNARPGDRGERLGLRPERALDLKRLLAVAARYARGGAA